MNTSPETAAYKIHISGHLDSHRIRSFAGMHIALLPEGITQFVGPVVDQAALYGLLSRIRDLGLPLLLVKRLDSVDEDYFEE